MNSKVEENFDPMFLLPSDQQKYHQQQEKDGDITFKFGNIDDYQIVERIGRGKYSTVFLGMRKDNTPCVLKVLKPVCLSKINKEIKILEELKGSPNVCELYDVVHDPESQSITIVMEYVDNIDFKSFYDQFTMDDLRYYMFNILKCLEHAHNMGIMHRDIKPQNIMIDHKTKKVRIIDWGLADHYVPNTPYQVRVATIHYKAPELLLGYAYYDFAVDIWGLGCTFASLIFRRIPFFRGRDNNEMLLRVVSFLGSDDFNKYIQKFSIQVNQMALSKLQDHKKKSWEELKTEKNEEMFDPLAIDLLSKMLVMDHTQRITAKEALNHKFFDSLRNT